MTSRWKLYLCLWLGAWALLFLAHTIRVEKDAGLIGEELASAYRNVSFLENRYISDAYASNYSTSIFFKAATHLVPISINSARLFKLPFTAAIAPLIAAIILHAVPTASLLTLIFAPALFFLIPSMTWYGILGIEFQVDATFSLALLLLCLKLRWDNPSKTRLQLALIGALTVWSIHFYSAQLPVIALSGAWVCVSFFRSGAFRTRVGWANLSGAAVLIAATACWPLLYFRENSIPFLANTAKAAFGMKELAESWHLLYSDLFTRSASYLIAGWIPDPAFPWKVTAIPVLTLLAAGLWKFRHNPTVLTWLAIAILSFAMTVFTHPNAGIRRATPLVIAMCIFASLGLETIRWKRASYAIAAALLIAQGFVFQSSFSFVSQNYQAWLQREYKLLPDMDYEETFEEILAQMQEGEVHLNDADYHWNYIFVWKLFCERRSLDCKLPRYQAKWIDPRFHYSNPPDRVPAGTPASY